MVIEERHYFIAECDFCKNDELFDGEMDTESECLKEALWADWEEVDGQMRCPDCSQKAKSKGEEK